MPNATPDPNSKAKAASQEKPLVPPEEKFWQRYSPHHEFPLSVASSIFLHVIVFGGILLIITGALLALLGLEKKSLPTDVIVIAGGGGNPQGIEGGEGKAPPQGPEAIQKEQTPAEPNPEVPPTELKKVEPEHKQILKDQSPSDRLVELKKSMSNNALSQIGQRARELIQSRTAPKGKGGTGSGGGEGAGKGTGTGNLTGPGVGNLTQRQKRQNRWIMVFNINDSEDYARQLQELGAILAIPRGGRDDYLVIRDLRQRPVQPKPEDITKINRIFWIDDKPHSVDNLARALGISPPPPYFAAFFPVDLENELRDKESRYYSGNEDDIQETFFRIERRGGHYEPVVERVVTRK